MFAAIATDTGWFRFPSVGEATFAAVTRLVAAGAKPHEIFAALYEQNSLPRLLLQGRILSNVKSQLGGRLLSSAITQADLKAVSAEATDTEDVINRLLGVAGVEVALFFLELGPQETKVSLRSRSAIDVNQVAAASAAVATKLRPGFAIAVHSAKPSRRYSLRSAMRCKTVEAKTARDRSRRLASSPSTLDPQLSTFYHG